MLVLGRNPGDYVVINQNVFVRLVKENGVTKFAIDAPKDVAIVRGEVYEKQHPRPDSIRLFDK